MRVWGLLACLLAGLLWDSSWAFNVVPTAQTGQSLPPRATMARLHRRPARSFGPGGGAARTTGGGHQGWRATASAPSEDVTEAPQTIEGDSFMFTSSWYPIFFTKYQDDTLPFKFTLMGHPLVFWKDLKGQWNAMADRCPHRLAPLSEGRVNAAGEIECPYHGWAFEGKSGACTSIPQAEEGAQLNAQRSCGIAVQVVEAQGLVWVWPEALYHPPGTRLPPADVGLIPLCETYEKHADILHDDMFRDVPYDYSLLLENVLDLSHVPFTHHKTQGNRDRGSKVIRFEQLEPTTTKGFKLQSRNTTSTLFTAPVSIHHSITFPTGAQMNVVAYCTPTTPGNARILARFPGVNVPKKMKRRKLLQPEFLQHMMRNGVLEDDNIFLHAQERNLVTEMGGNQVTGLAPDAHSKAPGLSGKWARSYYLAASADRPVVELRRWMDSFLPMPWARGTPAALGPEWPRERLLDRKTTHTDNCKTCKTALKRVQALRAALAVAGAVLAVAGRLMTDFALPKARIVGAVVPMILAALCAVAWHQLGKLESRFFVGPYPPVRNVVDL